MNFTRNKPIATIGGLLALALATAGCPGPQKPPEKPLNLSDDVDMGEPEPEPEKPPPEAGVVKLSRALMLGGKDLSREETDAASAAFVSSFDEGIHHFRRCYAAGLERNPELAGKLTVDVVLQSDGSIYELKLIAAELDDEEMVRCIVRAFRQLDYQPLGPGQYFSVTAPVSFKPE